jgi:6-phosphogluconolactonase (cycloisomerase 2 family)
MGDGRWMVRSSRKFVLVALVGLIAGCGSVSPGSRQLISIAVDPSVASIAAGLKLHYAATGIFSDGSKRDLSADVIWTSADAQVANIGATGLAEASVPGATTVTATFDGVAGASSLTVTAATLVSIGITPASLTETAGSSHQLQATGFFTDSSTHDVTSSVLWSSTEPSVASVGNSPQNAGLETALAVGSTMVSASHGAASATIELTVTAAVLATIGVIPATLTLAKGLSHAFTATGVYTDNSLHDLTDAVTWRSTQPGVLAVSNAAGSNGFANALAIGTSTLTATLGEVSGSATVSVTAATPVTLTLTPVNPGLAVGLSASFTATALYSDGSTQNVTAAAVWTSSVSAVASVGNGTGSSGVAVAASPGKTSIAAAFAGLSTATTLTVTAIEHTYVVNSGDNTLSQYVIGAQGALNPLADATVATGNDPVAVAVDPVAPYVYVANNLDGTVSAFRRATNGTLTSLGTAVATGNSPVAVVVEPTGHYAYVVNSGDGTLSQFAVGAGGALEPLNPAAVAVGGYPLAIAVDPASRYAYVANAAGTVFEFTIGAGGVLTALNPASAAAGLYPQAVVVDPAGLYVYVVNNGDDTVSQYAILPGGALSALNPAIVAAGGSPAAIAIDPSGRYAYEADGSGTVSQYTIGTGGVLTASSPAAVAAEDSPQAVGVDAAGLYVYVANEGDDLVSQFRIGAGGLLTPLAPATVGSGSAPVAIASSDD